MKKLTIGNGLDKSIKVGPIINKSGMGKIKKYIEIGRSEGAKLLAGGYELNDGEHENGHYFAPTLFTDATSSMRIAQEEIFGPVVSLIPVKSFEEGIDVNNRVTYGLSSCIFTSDGNCVFPA